MRSGQASPGVGELNCLASCSPDCVLKPFMFLPGAWDASNQEFVHQIVRRFYKRVTPYACPKIDNVIIANRVEQSGNSEPVPLKCGDSNVFGAAGL